MRTLNGSAAAALGCIWLVACGGSGESSVPNAADVQSSLVLRADGDTLRLKGSPVDAMYHASYANPHKINAMTVRIGALGKLEATCDGVSACAEIPFLASVTRAGDQAHVRVADVYGIMVMEGDLVAADDGQGRVEWAVPTSPPATSESGDTNARDGGVGSTDGADGWPDACAARKELFCHIVNEKYLNNTGISINCAEIADTLPDPVHGDDRPSRAITRCQEAIRSALVEATGSDKTVCPASEAWLSSTDGMVLSRGERECNISPLVLDLDGNGITLSSVDDGVSFDLLGTGTPVMTAWPRGGDAFLALDRNENGRVDDATELFGNLTGGSDHADGFAALAKLDADGDGRITNRDPMFHRLVVWRDARRDGLSSLDELMTLTEVRVVALDVLPVRVSGPTSFDEYKNEIPLLAGFTRRGGDRGVLVDAYLRFRP